MQLDKIFSTQFIDPDTRLPITNLTGVTFTLVEVSETDWTTTSTVVDAQPCINGWFWFYRYYYSAMNPNKVYEGFFNPNDSRCYPSPIHVDKRMNNLDQAVSDIRGWGGGWHINIQWIQTTIRNARDSIVGEITKNQTQTLDKFSETNSHIELAKTDLSNKIESIDIAETDLSKISESLGALKEALIKLSKFIRTEAEKEKNEEKKKITEEYESKISEMVDKIEKMEEAYNELDLSIADKEKLIEDMEKTAQEIMDELEKEKNEEKKKNEGVKKIISSLSE